ncbi:hypothetical protein GCM10011450_15940 [Advenella faeciporci]|uniref:Uncharacterized protein n=1 Tax=Advenella faeciporci TaxID=797535 RepID=A0A918JKY5_9BURK|nr:hypothetical protein GCM10011450_15940 [Advenella faeciporci]
MAKSILGRNCETKPRLNAWFKPEKEVAGIYIVKEKKQTATLYAVHTVLSK